MVLALFVLVFVRWLLACAAIVCERLPAGCLKRTLLWSRNGGAPVRSRQRCAHMPFRKFDHEEGGASVPSVDVTVEYRIFATAWMSPGFVKRLNAKMINAIDVPKAKARSEAADYTVVGSAPEELDRHVKVKIGRWGKVILEAGISTNKLQSHYLLAVGHGLNALPAYPGMRAGS